MPRTIELKPQDTLQDGIRISKWLALLRWMPELDRVVEADDGGVRTYDPVLGQFASVDPTTDPDDPQQKLGYTYSDNTPRSPSATSQG